MKPRLLISFVALAVLATACQRLDYIDVTPTDGVLTRKGQVLPLHAKAMDRQGHYYPDILFKWTTDDPRVATVNEKGEVKAVGSGRTWIAVAAGKVSAKVLVDVNLVERIKVLDPEVTLSVEQNERVAPRIEVYDRNGQPMEGRQVFLRPQDKSIVSVDGQGGLWPLKVGETIVTADVEGKTADIKVTVEK